MAARQNEGIDKGLEAETTKPKDLLGLSEKGAVSDQVTQTSLDQYTAPIDRKTFRQWMGIDSDEDRPQDTPPYFAPIPRRRQHWTPFRLLTGSSDADGMYGEVCFDEQLARWRYHLFNLVVNFSLVAQLGLSAAIVALSAMNDKYHVVVTAIGAVNGVLAGILSLIKGQGLPRRLMEYRNCLRRVREQIERVDRQLSVVFTAEQAPYILWADVKEIFDMYEDAHRTYELNHPENWNNDAGEARKLLIQTRGGRSGRGGRSITTRNER